MIEYGHLPPKEKVITHDKDILFNALVPIKLIERRYRSQASGEKDGKAP